MLRARLRLAVVSVVSIGFALASNVFASADDVSGESLSNCRANDAQKRIAACTTIIEARGYGSAAKLADALDGRCWAFHEIGKYNLAVVDCRAAIRLAPRNAYALNNLGTALIGLGDYQSALIELNSSIAIKPNFYWSRINRAKAAIALGHNEIAVADYTYLLSRDPRNQDLREALEKLRGSQGR